ncbi:integrase domain-containing protein [Dickeya fangzhongdai]|uniref:DNA-binding protein n=1 Tax=Dickeya fangzhongdai TaxID=1778540 RepID=A0A2K8QJZ1_9GAMM|nr:integrase domain-containing protein [Dickeya fangzhongdai]ATZ93050.1 DNA-binding protein [Dickeya fangzhongdai]QOH46481.1 DNA-binding protein [Dickeya fangzhongdai]QOH50787.1 DNA-binding protein [Dickeya fangzhongdai]WOY02033.1 integrase domain-containing protein [Dickeya fangzhongdai]GGB97815.1 DNA-binding protein [Dickeya fangzhongdai]
MSRHERLLVRDFVTLARRESGGFKTISDRSKIVERLARRLADLNIQIRSAEQLKVRHIELYMQSRQVENISKRTLQNEMSAIRAICRAAGKTKMADPDHERLSNKALGISNASRAGTKVAISDERYHTALALVKEKDEGVAAVMQLARHLGLRNEEAVQSAKSIKTWRQALLRGDDKVRVVFGTKGGRPRDTRIIDRDKLLAALNNAIDYADTHNGKLIDKPSLSQAMDRYINVMRRTGGLVNEESNHGLRYAYAQDAEAYYKSQGFSEKEAYALTSMDLGHGDGRGDYIKRVYSQKLNDADAL